MSDLSTNNRTSTVGYGGLHNHTRPKFQPVRVKFLLNLGETDDDDSEDKPQDSDIESDSDDPQPLPQDDSTECENILPTLTNLQTDCQDSNKLLDGLHAAISPKAEESTPADNCKESKPNDVIAVALPYKIDNNRNDDVKQDNHKSRCSIRSRQIDPVGKYRSVMPPRSISSSYHDSDHNTRTDKNSNSEVLNNLQSCYENVQTQENLSQKYLGNKQTGTEGCLSFDDEICISKQSTEDRSRWNDRQVKDEFSSCKISDGKDTVTCASRNSGIPQQSDVFNLPCANVKLKTSEPRLSMTEEQSCNENTGKSLTDSGYLNSIDHLSMETPLKHTSASSLVRPNPCFARRNITETPQNKLQSDLSKNHGLTPATIFSHWSLNNVRQTPLQCKTMSATDCKQTPKNTVFPPATLFANTESKSVRRPLADASSLTHSEVPMYSVESKLRLLQGGTRLSKVGQTMAQSQKILGDQRNASNENSKAKRMLVISENVVRPGSDVNEELKENKHPNVEKPMQNKMLENRCVTDCNASLDFKNSLSQMYDKDSKPSTKTVCNDSQNQYPLASNQNQQTDSRQIEGIATGVQFLMPSNVPKPKQNKTICVKGQEYLVLGTLGKGMSGEVFRVQNLATCELCAIKCVNLSTMDKDAAQGCLEEISMLHRLQAPCIVRMFDYEIKYPLVYVVMEMGDTDLSRLLKSRESVEKQLPLTMILYYWTEMLTAVRHIHNNGVIHSDLKPANFLLVRGRLKLIDFGIASNINSDMTSVVKNCPIGTLNYISPEALMDTGGNSDSPTHNKYKISFKSDVWSLGCILYSLVYGQTPFHHIRSQWAKVNAITNPKPNISFPTTLPLSEGNHKSGQSPPVLIDVMRRCLQHDPKARPTVAQLLQIEYIPTKQAQIRTLTPDIPTSILVKIKHTLNENEWRQLTQILESTRRT